MERKCYRCHFLSVYYKKREGDKKIILNMEGRDKLGEMNNIAWLKEGYRTVLCWHGVWYENFISDQKIKEQIFKERGKTCFWFKYNKNMLPEAASTLQKREEDREKLKDSIRRSNLALYMAIATLVITTFIQILPWFVKVCFLIT